METRKLVSVERDKDEKNWFLVFYFILPKVLPSLSLRPRPRSRRNANGHLYAFHALYLYAQQSGDVAAQELFDCALKGTESNLPRFRRPALDWTCRRHIFRMTTDRE